MIRRLPTDIYRRVLQRAVDHKDIPDGEYHLDPESTDQAEDIMIDRMKQPMTGKESLENLREYNIAQHQATIQAQCTAGAIPSLPSSEGLFTINSQVVVAENGFVLATPDQYGAPKKFSIAPTVADLEGLMRQWLDERISEIKQWDHWRGRTSSTAKNGEQ